MIFRRELFYSIDYKVLTDSFSNGLRLGVNMQLFVYAGDVRANGPHADEAACGDHFITISPYQAAKHIYFT